jgi:arginine repressor
MDRSLLLGQLVRTEEHIGADERHLRRQQSLIEELERRGQDTTYARSLLRGLQEMQAMRIADRDRMRAALKNPCPSFDQDT